MKFIKEDTIPIECLVNLERCEKLFPRYPAQEKADLIEYYRSGQQTPPITVSERYQIVDGYNRRDGHKMSDLDMIRVEIYAYSSEDEMEIHGILLNAKRRHLDSITLARFAKRLSELQKPSEEETRRKLSEAGKKGGKGRTNANAHPLDRPSAIKKAAKKVGVSEKTVRAVAKVDATKDSFLISAMEKKKIPLDKAASFADIRDQNARAKAVQNYIDDTRKIFAPLNQMADKMAGKGASDAYFISAACVDCIQRLERADKQVKYNLLTEDERRHQLTAVESVGKRLLDIKNKLERAVK